MGACAQKNLAITPAAGGGVGARTEALGGGRGGTFWYWNGMLPAVRVKRGSARYLFHVTRMPRGWMRLVRRPGDDALRGGGGRRGWERRRWGEAESGWRPKKSRHTP